MYRTKRHLLEDIKQELCLPEIDADACVHSLCNDSDCHACVDACPAQAWVLDDEILGLDIEACDGCGLCVPACPTGALHIHFPWVLRQLGAQMVALFACDKSGINESSGILPCIHALGLRQLLQLYNSGIEHLLLATAECKNCSRYRPEGLNQRLEQLNHLLFEHNKSPIVIMQRSNKVWIKVFRTDETVSRGTQVSRRNFLRGGGQQIRQQLLIIDPLNHSEFQTIPPGKLLPEVGENKVHWPWVPELDEKQCNGCDACMKLCPTDALNLSRSSKDSSEMYELNQVQLRYEINPQNCTGCGICTAVCKSDAISIHSWSLSIFNQISLSENTCSACGNTFHLPEQHCLSDEVLCRICEHHNHSSDLYQVLTKG
ncbi:MAG: 4Fe-4S binding protein [gamma proteobacterium symbiont of Taylorina sp.]|nr:4Fe-4S binding protein [gamma proteobacterium symbiont of Taylorina sp.]